MTNPRACSTSRTYCVCTARQLGRLCHDDDVIEIDRKPNALLTQETHHCAHDTSECVRCRRDTERQTTKSPSSTKSREAQQVTMTWMNHDVRVRRFQINRRQIVTTTYHVTHTFDRFVLDGLWLQPVVQISIVVTPSKLDRVLLRHRKQER
jgi:hypothetical protein